MYGGSYYPKPADPRGPRIVPLRNRDTIPTINVEPEPDPAQTMLGTIATSFQSTLGVVMTQFQEQANNNAQIIAQTVAQAVSQATADSRERDMRLVLQLQRETLEAAHNKELQRIKEEENAKKRERTEDTQDLLQIFFSSWL